MEVLQIGFWRTLLLIIPVGLQITLVRDRIYLGSDFIITIDIYTPCFLLQT